MEDFHGSDFEEESLEKLEIEEVIYLVLWNKS